MNQPQERQDSPPDDVAPPGERAPFPVQAVLDPATGRNITGDFVQAIKRDLERRIREILDRARTRREKGENTQIIYNELQIEIEQAVTDHFNALKLPPDQGVLAEYTAQLADVLGLGLESGLEKVMEP